MLRFLAAEAQSAQNIRRRETRERVAANIAAVCRLVAPSPTGSVVVAGPVGGGDALRLVPPAPVPRFSYRCGPAPDLVGLADLFHRSPRVGLVAMDATEAAVG